MQTGKPSNVDFYGRVVDLVLGYDGEPGLEGATMVFDAFGTPDDYFCQIVGMLFQYKVSTGCVLYFLLLHLLDNII